MIPDPAAITTRTGYVTLVGRPNAGKSTLMNRLVGEHLSIVTPKAQTTWQRVTGILTAQGVQLIFLDTPGLLRAKDLLQRSMLASAMDAIGEADVVLLVVDASRHLDELDKERITAALEGVQAPVHAVLNKIDQAPEEALQGWESWLARRVWTPTLHRVCALDGRGIEELLDGLRTAVPEGPFLYPEEDIAASPVRFFVAEMVRETVFEQYQDEIPYSTFCVVEEFQEDQDPIYIRARIFVERASQKGIVLGAGGRAIRELGQAARAKIEQFVGRRVYLDLWVKPLKSWRKDRARLGELGFRVPEDDAKRRG